MDDDAVGFGDGPTGRDVERWAGGILGRGSWGSADGEQPAFWDATNNRLRVGGTTAPVERLEVAG
ncbi:MAG: hypothetical protein RMJ46_08490, partial [Bacteroidota bacterium]|nr:hypothetical protein [Bacteroidota bacterium]